MTVTRANVDDEWNEDETAQRISFSITSYGVDYPVDGLVKRINSGDIYIPKFQREFVWTVPQSSRFIESLLLGLPVPGIFLSKEMDTRKLLVIDGQQRLLSLKHFYDGNFPDESREFSLRGVQEEFKGLTYRTLREEERRRLDDSIIHATIVQQDEVEENDSSIYYIFQRLNTGGTLLLPQEIRSSIYHGELKALLDQLNENVSWRSIFGPKNDRMRDRELILRFFALYYTEDRYKAPMNEFLNHFMSKNKNLEPSLAREFENLFSATIDLIYQKLGEDAFKPAGTLNAAVFDAVMVAVARLLTENTQTSFTLSRASYERLLIEPNFKAATETGTAKENSVHSRICLAKTTLGHS